MGRLAIRGWICGIPVAVALLATASGALAAPPANDAYADAQLIGSLPADVEGTTTGATVQPGEDDYFLDPNYGESVWYRWTAPADMRVWIDNCGAPTDTNLTVYEGSVLETQKRVTTLGQPACSADDVFGRREEFRAKRGVEYRIRSFSQLYADGPFHLRMQQTVLDATLTQTASRSVVKKGKTVTYTVDVANIGTVTIDPWIDLVTSKPGKLSLPVVGARYVSLTTTAGTCERVEFFAIHPGALCKVTLDPGAHLRIKATLKPSASLSHWVELNYGHGGDTPIFDDDRSNDNGPTTRLDVRVKKAKKKHRHRGHRGGRHHK